MWIFTKHGIFDTSCDRIEAADSEINQLHLSVDRERIVVKGLVVELERLRDEFFDELGTYQIDESDTLNYTGVLQVEKADWAKVLVGLAEEMDYENLQSEVAGQEGIEGPYARVLDRVGRLIARLHK